MTTGDTTDLSERAAKAVMRQLEQVILPADERLDYVDLALLGLWRGIDAGARVVPTAAIELLHNRSDATSSAAARDRNPTLTVPDDAISDLLRGIVALRLLGGRSHISRMDELVADGLTLALMIARVKYAGRDSIDFVAKALTAARALNVTAN